MAKQIKGKSAGVTLSAACKAFGVPQAAVELVIMLIGVDGGRSKQAEALRAVAMEYPALAADKLAAVIHAGVACSAFRSDTLYLTLPPTQAEMAERQRIADARKADREAQSAAVKLGLIRWQREAIAAARKRTAEKTDGDSK